MEMYLILFLCHHFVFHMGETIYSFWACKTDTLYFAIPISDTNHLLCVVFLWNQLHFHLCCYHIMDSELKYNFEKNIIILFCVKKSRLIFFFSNLNQSFDAMWSKEVQAKEESLALLVHKHIALEFSQSAFKRSNDKRNGT